MTDTPMKLVDGALVPMTSADLAQASTDASATPYTPPPTFTFLQFIALFTSSEQAAIVQSTDVQVRLFVLKAAGATFISLVDSATKAGLDYLVSIGLLAQARETAILASPAPAAG